jgi:hypothetical protein
MERQIDAPYKPDLEALAAESKDGLGNVLE